MKYLVTIMLRILARQKIRHSHARVIGITGSVGKTTTKDAIVHVLSQQYRVKYAESGYNTEIGIPLMILGLKAPSGSPLGWGKILLKGIKSACTKEAYDVMVVEMGVDTPGDMDMLLKVIHPDIAILTHIARVHVGPGQFANELEILKEKSKIFSKLTHTGIGIINVDNELIRSIKGKIAAPVLTYGTRNEANLHIKDVKSSGSGLTFCAEFRHHMAQFALPIVGKHHISSIAPAIIVAATMGMSMNTIAERLTTFSLPKGRMNIIPGMKGSTIIDSSYNASPVAVVEALKILNEIQGKRRILCLGQMNELGKSSEMEHRKIGQLAPAACDLLITVHGDAELIGEEAGKNGLRKNAIRHFATSAEAGAYLKSKVTEGDVIMVKGSQNRVFMEELIKCIMKTPQDAETLLVRQDAFWKRKKKLPA